MNLQSLLAASRATEAFKSDVESYFRGGAAPRVELAHSAPPIKVQRLLAHLLEAEPDLEIERVSIDARSGCSDFRGTIRVETADAVQDFEFTWCCRWRAEEAGFTDFFGYPDQIRAAMVFKWRCFKVWRTAVESSIASSS
jgi:hypothetical protein